MLLVAILTLLAALPAAAFPAPALPSFPDTLTEIARFSPRPEGSAAEKELLSMIDSRLRREGLSPAAFDFRSADFAHSFSSCLRVDLPGTSPDRLIIAVPVDSPPNAPAGTNGSINVALALDLISRVNGTIQPLSLTILFLGAEAGDTPEYPLGSTLFLRDFRPDYRAAVLYLNLRDESSGVVVMAGGRGTVTPYWLVERCVDALRGAGIHFELPGDQTQLFRMGTTDQRTLVEPYLLAGYPAVGLESTGPSASPDASTDAAGAASLSRFLDAFLAAGSAGVPE